MSADPPGEVRYAPSVLRVAEQQQQQQQQHDVAPVGQAPKDEAANDADWAPQDAVSLIKYRASPPPISGTQQRSDYYERSILDEYSLLREQQDSSIVSLNLVPAVPSDPTIIVPRSATSAAAALPPRNVLDQLTVLRTKGFPVGLAMEIGYSHKSAFRFIVCHSNSNSELIKSDVEDYAFLADVMQVQTVFCIGEQQEFVFPDAQTYSGTNRIEPTEEVVSAIRGTGKEEATTLTQTTLKLVELAKRIETFEDTGHQVVVVIVTDHRFGTTKGREDRAHREFVSALASLQRLSVQIVIRLTTVDANAADYFSHVKLIHPLTVIHASLEREARAVYAANPWLNYAMPLHRCRELGYRHRTWDLLDKRLLNKDELREFLVLLFGKKVMRRAPDIGTEWREFADFLTDVNLSENQHYRFNSKKREHWIDMKRLEKSYGGGRGWLPSLFSRRGKPKVCKSAPTKVEL